MRPGPVSDGSRPGAARLVGVRPRRAHSCGAGRRPPCRQDSTRHRLSKAALADYQPVLPGQQSRAVLLSNLANRVQPMVPTTWATPSWPGPTPARAADVLTALIDGGDRFAIIAINIGGWAHLLVPIP